MGNYVHAWKPLAELVADEVVVAPPITKRTAELGFKHSPECVCIPFKYNLGNFIEALELGANALIQGGGGCRFGHYAEVQEGILRKLGYDFRFIKLNDHYGIAGLARDFKNINPKISYFAIAKILALCRERVRCLDAIEDYVRKNIGFEKNKGEFDAALEGFLARLGNEYSIRGVWRLKKEFQKKFSAIGTDKPENCLRVGVIGEIYAVMEPFCNFNLEKELAKYGVEITRFVNVTRVLHDFFSGGRNVKQHVKSAWPYLKYSLGAHGTESVARAEEMIRQGFDGIIHLKPFGCMPEVNAMSALNNLSKDFRVPILYFSFDSQTSRTGIATRLEAFYDMLHMKKHQAPNSKQIPMFKTDSFRILILVLGNCL